MSEYTLNTDEVLIIDEDARINDTYANGHVALTNQRVIVIHKEKKMFHKETVLSDSYPVEDLITKDGQLRFKQKGDSVYLYFANTEIKADFFSYLSAAKFTNALTKLFTGKTVLDRGAERIRGAISFVDNTLGINAKKVVSSVIDNGMTGAIIGVIGKKVSPALENRTVSKALTIGKNIVDQFSTDKGINENSIPNPISLNDQIEAVKELKELLDAGILTQDEFDAKKKEIMFDRNAARPSGQSSR